MLPILHAVTPDRLLVREPARARAAARRSGHSPTIDKFHHHVFAMRGFMASRDARGGPPMSAARHLNRLFARCARGVVEFRSIPSGRKTWTTLGALVGRRHIRFRGAPCTRDGARRTCHEKRLEQRHRTKPLRVVDTLCRHRDAAGRDAHSAARPPVPPVACDRERPRLACRFRPEGTVRPDERRRIHTGRLAHASTQRVPRWRSTSDESGDRAALVRQFQFQIFAAYAPSRSLTRPTTRSTRASSRTFSRRRSSGAVRTRWPPVFPSARGTTRFTWSFEALRAPSSFALATIVDRAPHAEPDAV